MSPGYQTGGSLRYGAFVADDGRAPLEQMEPSVSG